MTYRLDEHRIFSNCLTRNKQIWLEKVKIQPDGEIFYSELYVQVPLIKLLKYLNR